MSLDKCIGDINSKKSWVDTYGKKGDEANMNKNIKLLEDILAANEGAFNDEKGAKAKADALECIKKAKATCIEEISKDKIRSVTGTLNSKKSWCEGAAKNQDKNQVNKYVTDAKKILEENDQWLQSADGQKLKHDTLAWISACEDKCSAISDNDIRGLKGDVNRLSNWLDRPDSVGNEKKVGEYLEQANKLLADKEKYFDFNADAKAAKAQLEKSISGAKAWLASKSAGAAAAKPAAAPAAGAAKPAAAAAKPAAAPLASGSELSVADQREFTGLANRLNSWINNPESVMESGGPEKLQQYIDQAEAGLTKFAAHKSAAAISKAYTELETNVAKSKKSLAEEGPKYAAHMDERDKLEEQMQAWSMREKTVSLKNEDKGQHKFTISAVFNGGGAINSDTSVNSNNTNMNFCNEGDKITIHATKASLVVPKGCKSIVVKNNTMSAL